MCITPDVAYTVLIVEDEAILAKNIASYLSRHGIVATAVGSGMEALGVLAKVRPDVVLVDYDLPGMDGLALIRRIRDVDPDLPVLMLTGQGDAALAARAVGAGAREYLSKPIALADLRRALDRALA